MIRKEIYTGLSKYTEDFFKDDSNLVAFFKNYIDLKEIIVPEDPSLSRETLENIMYPLRKTDYFMDINQCMMLIQNIPELETLLKQIVTLNMSTIKAGELYKISKNQNIQSLIESYCSLNKIETSI